MIAHRTTESGPENKTAAVQVIQVGPDHAEQSAEVFIARGWIRMKLGLRDFGLDQRSDLQAALLVASRLSEKVGLWPETRPVAPADDTKLV
jgi:hypothetical protein